MTRYQVPREETSIHLTNISEQVYCIGPISQLFSFNQKAFPTKRFTQLFSFNQKAEMHKVYFIKFSFILINGQPISASVHLISLALHFIELIAPDNSLHNAMIEIFFV